ncbi:hypothetical protein GY45DRAFT_12038 [Cubamyces sp. BRFM 1775]|nr:hypothetical protein GY45DRAFT_12038 [Cubamyces sp. BRFM 1775]
MSDSATYAGASRRRRDLEVFEGTIPRSVHWFVLRPVQSPCNAHSTPHRVVRCSVLAPNIRYRQGVRWKFSRILADNVLSVVSRSAPLPLGEARLIILSPQTPCRARASISNRLCIDRKCCTTLTHERNNQSHRSMIGVYLTATPPRPRPYLSPRPPLRSLRTGGRAGIAGLLCTLHLVLPSVCPRYRPCPRYAATPKYNPPEPNVYV